MADFVESITAAELRPSPRQIIHGVSAVISLISTMFCLFRIQKNAKRRSFLLLLTCIDIFCRFQVRMSDVFISCTSLLNFWSLMFFILVLFLSLSFRWSPPYCTNAHQLHLLQSKSLSHWRLLVKFVHFKWTYLLFRAKHFLEFCHKYLWCTLGT